MKKLGLAIAFAAISSTAFSQSAFSGFYGQLSTGYESNSVTNSQNASIYRPGGALAVQDSRNNSYSSNSSPLVMGAGYFWDVKDSYLLGIGADYSIPPSSTNTVVTANSRSFGTFTTPGLSNQFKISNRYNIYVTPAYAIDKDKLAYIKAGYSNQNVGLMVSNSNGGGGNKTTSTSGYILGLGYKQMIAKGIYGFAEYNYMKYSNANLGNSGSIAGGASWAASSSASSNAYNFLIGVGYAF